MNVTYSLFNHPILGVVKTARSDSYNYDYFLKSGIHARWGATSADDPIMAPMPEILDIEVSEVCHGPGKPCAFCYKSNTAKGGNMTFEQFKNVFDKSRINLCSIAFGIGDIDGNPDLFKMFDYCIDNHVVPNVTINGWRMTPEYYDALVSRCGAVSVSRYEPKDVCYDAIHELTSRGLEQANIHMVVSEESYDACFELIDDISNDKRLEKLNACIFLALKPKGKRNTQTPIYDADKFNKLMEYAHSKGVMKVGMDSCSAPSYLNYSKTAELYKDDKVKNKMLAAVDPCESTLFSLYVNWKGEAYPCSFTEGESGWETDGVDILSADNFEQVWNHPRISDWRMSLLSSTSGCKGSCEFSGICRKCPVFDIGVCGRD